MGKRSAIVIVLAALAALAVFSSTAVASGPGLIKDPTKLDFGTTTVSIGFGPKDVTIINNTGGFTPNRGVYTLSGDTDANGQGPFAVDPSPASSSCIAPNTASSSLTGVTRILGTRQEGDPLFPPECVFEIDFIGIRPPGIYKATLNASFGAKKVSIPITAEVVANP